jgi:hypothetical protein
VDLNLIYRDRNVKSKAWIPAAMLAVWFCVVCTLVRTHLLWRDEVRALSIATYGDNLLGMLKGLHGEGHPSVWYLLLRAAHVLFPRPQVLLAVALSVATAAIVVFVLRAPFRWSLIALILAGRFSIFEYSVMARNYGISMLLLFLFAVLYERHREKGYLLGVLLFLLANCNVHSALSVAGLLIFWFVDIQLGESASRPGRMRLFWGNAVLAAMGFVACVLTVFPTTMDAAVTDRHQITLKALAFGLFLPAAQFHAAFQESDMLWLALPMIKKPMLVVQSFILFGSTLGLLRRPGAFLAAISTLVAYSMFFVVVYPGGYRHQALWIVLLICLYLDGRATHGTDDARHLP